LLEDSFEVGNEFFKILGRRDSHGDIDPVQSSVGFKFGHPEGIRLDKM
jgi:hypothetical protein